MMREIRFAFPLAGGLHARPATLLRGAARRFASRVTLANLRNGREANARSTLALVATLTRGGDECVLRVEGEDEEQAVEAIGQLLASELPLAEERPPAPETTAPLPRALRGEGVTLYRGTPASGGIAHAPVRLLRTVATIPNAVPRKRGSPEHELVELHEATARAAGRLRERLDRAIDRSARGILAAQLALLEDEELGARIEGEIRAGCSAAAAVAGAAEHFAGVLREAGTVYLRERALDLEDVAAQLLHALTGDGSGETTLTLASEAVVVAEDLGPSQFLALDPNRLKSLVLARGGATSHTAILARAREIPCVTGVAAIHERLEEGHEVVVDGERGLVIAAPSPAVIAFYEGERAKLATLGARLKAEATRPAASADGRPLAVEANVSSTAEAALAFACGAEGIGLFRSEMLFLQGAGPPTEEQQAEVFAETARLAAGRPVTLRTLDVGADKAVPYLGLPAERNPALGARAVRIYARHEALVAAHLRAMLRAGAYGKVRLMFPMVGSPEEMRTLRGLVLRLQDELAAQGAAAGELEVGAMIEVPAAAFVLDQLAREADFFSIGTNDLAQYFFAAERDNPGVAPLASPLQPAFLRLLHRIVTDAHALGRRVGLCGELAGNVLATPLLVGLGLDEVSVSPPAVPAVKAAIRASSSTDCERLLEQALRQDTAAGVEELLRGFASVRAVRELVSEETVRLASRSRSREGAIRELVDLLHLTGRAEDADALEEAVWQREETASTAVGLGVAIPHCTSPVVRSSSVAMVRFETPVDWGEEGEPVVMAILIALREDAEREAHLRTIAALSRTLMDDAFRAALGAAADAREVVALLRRGLAPGEGGG